MLLQIYSHRQADCIISNSQILEIKTVLEENNFVISKNCTKELRNCILGSIEKLGWSKEIRINPMAGLTITSIKTKVALCLQTGNISRIYADLLKLQYTFAIEKVVAAIYILPSKMASKKIGNNIATFERMVEELKIFNNIIYIPLYIIGIN